MSCEFMLSYFKDTNAKDGEHFNERKKYIYPNDESTM